MVTHYVGVVQLQPARFVYISCHLPVFVNLLDSDYSLLLSVFYPKLMTGNLIEYSFAPSRKFPDLI